MPTPLRNALDIYEAFAKHIRSSRTIFWGATGADTAGPEVMTRAAGHTPNVYTYSEVSDAFGLAKALRDAALVGHRDIYVGPLHGGAETRESEIEVLVAQKVD
jgi:hypothetical protein